EQRLAGDATDAQTRSPEFLVLLHDGCPEAELPCANRSDVTAGTGTDNYNIKFFHLTRFIPSGVEESRDAPLGVLHRDRSTALRCAPDDIKNRSATSLGFRFLPSP